MGVDVVLVHAVPAADVLLAGQVLLPLLARGADVWKRDAFILLAGRGTGERGVSGPTCREQEHCRRSNRWRGNFLGTDKPAKGGRRRKLTDALSVLDALVAPELEVEAARGGDAVVEERAVGHEVPEADPLTAAVGDLHVLDDDAVDSRLVLVAVLLGEAAVVALAWDGMRPSQILKVVV